MTGFLLFSSRNKISMSDSIKAVILAAGKGTRMRELTQEMPKPMLEVRGKPILEHILDGILQSGVKDVFIVTGFRAEVLEDYFGDGSKWGANIVYGRQEVQDGTGRAPAVAKEFVGSSPFLLTYGDILSNAGAYQGLIKTYEEKKSRAVLAVTPGQDVTKGAVVILDEDDRMVRLVEKPSQEDLANLRAEGFLQAEDPVWYNAGIYLFQPCIYEFIAKLKKSPRGEYELTDAIIAQSEAFQASHAFNISEDWVDVRDPEILSSLQS